MVQLHVFGLGRDRVRSAMAGLLGIGLTDLDALEHLERFGPQTQRELGRRLLLTSGAVTLLVDRLESLDLVRRRPHPGDRRATLVELAPDAVLPELPEMADYHRELLTAAQKLSPAARQEVVELLQRLTAAADQAADGMRARTPARPRQRAAARAAQDQDD